MPRRLTILALFAAALAACSPAPERAGDAGDGEAQVVNLYTARHYDSDLRIYEAFTRETGIEVRRIEMPANELIERLRAEGPSSPADVVVIADAGAMGRAAEAGLLQPLRSEVLEARVPAHLQDPQDRWFAISRRARIVAYDRARVRPEEVAAYEALATPRFRGRLCVRSSDNAYNLSLMAALIERWGPERALEWARGVVANMARPPQGGDRDQIRAVAAGQCEVAITNSYYYLALIESEDPADAPVRERVALAFPSLDGRGAHVNVSGAGMAAHAPHPEAARRFIEFLTGSQAQRVFAEVTNEFPVAADTPLPEDVAAIAGFQADPLPVSAYGPRQGEAQRLFESAGWR